MKTSDFSYLPTSRFLMNIAAQYSLYLFIKRWNIAKYKRDLTRGTTRWQISCQSFFKE